MDWSIRQQYNTINISPVTYEVEDFRKLKVG